MIDKTYRCDICRDRVGAEDRPAKRVKFKAGKLTLVDLEDNSASETVICDKCRAALTEAAPLFEEAA